VTVRSKVLLIGIVALYLALAQLSASTLMPWCDEAWFAGPALNLLTKGYMGTPVLDPTAEWHVRDLTGIDRYTYWIEPLYPLSQTIWFHFFNFGLFSVRLYSVFWGLVALASWLAIVWKLSGQVRAGVVTAGLLAVDFQFVWSASVGRMDMMCGALGASGIAAFLWLRERNLGGALLAGTALVVAAGLTHPVAISTFAGFVALAWYLDGSRIRFHHLAMAALPFLVGAASWGWYIARDPAVFWAQYKGNVSDRLVSGPLLEWLRSQSIRRYLFMYGLAPDTHGFSHIKIVVLLFYLAGLVGALTSGAIRGHKGYRALLLYGLVASLVIAAVDKDIQSFYLVHLVMPLAAITAVWLCSMWEAQRQARWALAGIVAGALTVQLAVAGSRIVQDPYHKNYLSATQFLKQHATAGDVVFGSAELAFQLGFDGQVIDDYRLGFRTGKKASFVVLDQNRYVEWIANLEKQEPQTYQYIQSMLHRDFRLVHVDGAYQIYERKSLIAKTGLILSRLGDRRDSGTHLPYVWIALRNRQS